MNMNSDLKRISAHNSKSVSINGKQLTSQCHNLTQQLLAFINLTYAPNIQRGASSNYILGYYVKQQVPVTINLIFFSSFINYYCSIAWVQSGSSRKAVTINVEILPSTLSSLMQLMKHNCYLLCYIKIE